MQQDKNLPLMKGPAIYRIRVQGRLDAKWVVMTKLLDVQKPKALARESAIVPEDAVLESISRAAAALLAP